MKRLCLLAVLLFIAGAGIRTGILGLDRTTHLARGARRHRGRQTHAIIYVGSKRAERAAHGDWEAQISSRRALAQRIAEELGDALVYPVLPYAITGNALTRTGHMRFPGSVSLRPKRSSAWCAALPRVL